MKIPPRIAIPVAAAVLMVAGTIGVLFWQLEGTRAYLAAQLNDLAGKTVIPVNPSPNPVTLTGNEALLHLRKGDIAALRGEWAEAQREYQAAVNADGGITALRKLAQAQLQRRDIRGATASLDQLRRSGARSEDLLLLESIINLRTGEVAKARSLLQAADDSPHKHYGLALLAIIGGDHESARTELALVAAGWEPVLRSYAHTLNAAYEEYALFPESPEIHLQTLLSRSLAQAQECELALPILSHVTHTQDDYRDAWIVQGYCELTSERTTEALASLERAYQIDPEKAEIQYFLARAYIAKGDHANALTFLQYALRNGFEPQAEVRRLLAQEALAMNNPALALDQYEALTQKDDAGIETFQAYVAAAITAGKNEEAYAKAQQAITLWPDSAEAHELLGWSAQVTNRTEEAKAELEKALALDPALKSAKQRLEDL